MVLYAAIGMAISGLLFYRYVEFHSHIASLLPAYLQGFRPEEHIEENSSGAPRPGVLTSLTDANG